MLYSQYGTFVLIWVFGRSAFCSFWVMSCVSRSYMNTEQYEEAVRDYEKVYQTEKTSGKLLTVFSFHFFCIFTCYTCWYYWFSHTRMCFFVVCFFPRFNPSRSQASAEDSTAGAEEEQEERLLQGAGCRQERHRGRDQKGLSQTGPHAPPR